jgi:hypothetical protein
MTAEVAQNGAYLRNEALEHSISQNVNAGNLALNFSSRREQNV